MGVIKVDKDHDERPGYWRITIRTDDGALFTSARRWPTAEIDMAVEGKVQQLIRAGAAVLVGPVAMLSRRAGG